MYNFSKSCLYESFLNVLVCYHFINSQGIGMVIVPLENPTVSGTEALLLRTLRSRKREVDSMCLGLSSCMCV